MGRAYPTLPKGETVATFETYPEAQAAVDTLAKAEFPVKELAIVGTDLTSVERITGKLTLGPGGAARGRISGAWFGTFLGLLFFIFSPTGTSVGILISAMLIGAGFGMIFGLVSYSVNRRRRDFTSTKQVLATRYAIIAEPAHVDQGALRCSASTRQSRAMAASRQHAGRRSALPSDELRRGDGCRAPGGRGEAAGAAGTAARERPRYGEYAADDERARSRHLRRGAGRRSSRRARAPQRRRVTCARTGDPARLSGTRRAPTPRPRRPCAGCRPTGSRRRRR